MRNVLVIISFGCLSLIAMATASILGLSDLRAGFIGGVSFGLAGWFYFSNEKEEVK